MKRKLYLIKSLSEDIAFRTEYIFSFEILIRNWLEILKYIFQDSFHIAKRFFFIYIYLKKKKITFVMFEWMPSFQLKISF